MVLRLPHKFFARAIVGGVREDGDSKVEERGREGNKEEERGRGRERERKEVGRATEEEGEEEETKEETRTGEETREREKIYVVTSIPINGPDGHQR